MLEMKILSRTQILWRLGPGSRLSVGAGMLLWNFHWERQLRFWTSVFLTRTMAIIRVYFRSKSAEMCTWNTVHSDCNQYYLKVILSKIVKWKWKLLSPVWLFETLYSPWNSLGQNTGVGSLSLLQQIFLTQESNQGLLYGRQILDQVSYQGSP